MLCIFLITVKANADEVDELWISKDGKSYSLYEEKGAEEILQYSSDKLANIVEYICKEYTSARIVFYNIDMSEDICFDNGSFMISGGIYANNGASIKISGASIVFGDVYLSFFGGGVMIEKGELMNQSGSIKLESGAVVEIVNDGASFKMAGGEIVSYGDSSAIIHSAGSAEIYGGIISAEGECAIEAKSEISIYQSPLIKGDKYGISTDGAISLGKGEKHLEMGTRVKFNKDFAKGTAEIHGQGHIFPFRASSIQTSTINGDLDFFIIRIGSIIAPILSAVYQIVQVDSGIVIAVLLCIIQLESYLEDLCLPGIKVQEVRLCGIR